MTQCVDLQTVVLHALEELLESEPPDFVYGISFGIRAPTIIVHVFIDGNIAIWDFERFDRRLRDSFKKKFNSYGDNGLGLLVISHSIPDGEVFQLIESPFYIRNIAPPENIGTALAPPSAKKYSLDDPMLEPLVRWNRLAKENAENAIVNSMFSATRLASQPVDDFATWLLVAAAAVGSFFVVNAEKILPLLGQVGYLLCGLSLCISCFFGILSKLFGLQSKNAKLTGEAVAKSFAEQYEKHQEEEKKIKEGAKFWGVEIETDIRMSRVLSEYYKPMPKLVSWIAKKLIEKNMNEPQVAHILPMKIFFRQGLTILLQALGLLFFLVGGVIFAAINYS